MSAWLQLSEPLNNKLFQLRLAINGMWSVFMVLHALLFRVWERK